VSGENGRAGLQASVVNRPVESWLASQLAELQAAAAEAIWSIREKNASLAQDDQAVTHGPSHLLLQLAACWRLCLHGGRGSSSAETA